MKHQNPRSFTVEVKRGKRRSPWLISSLQDSGDSHQDTASIADCLRHTAEAAFTTPNGSQPSSVATPDQVTEARAAPERRILPDLTSEDPLQGLMRQEAERRAFLDGRRAPRPKRAKATTRKSDQVSGESAFQEAGQSPHGEEPDRVIEPKAPVAKKPASAAPIRIRPKQTPPTIAKRQDRKRSRREAYRLAGHPDALRPGERWKRRLPQICW